MASDVSLRNDRFCLHAALWSSGRKRVVWVSGFSGASLVAVRARTSQTRGQHRGVRALGVGGYWCTLHGWWCEVPRLFPGNQYSSAYLEWMKRISACPLHVPKSGKGRPFTFYPIGIEFKQLNGLMLSVFT